MLGSLAGSAINYFGQQRMLKGQEKMADERFAAAQGAEAAARQGLDTTQYSVSPALREAYAMSKQDPAADALRANQQRQEAQSLEALKASGPRGLAMLNQVSDAQAQQRAGIEADSFARQQEAAQTFGAQQQNVNNMNIANQRALLEHDFGRAQGQMDTYQSYGDQLGVARQQLGRQALSGLASDIVPGVLDQFGITHLGGQRLAFGAGGKVKFRPKSYGKGGTVKYNKGGKFPDLTGDGKVTRADILKGRGVFAEGGVMGGNPFEEGGELPGEFSHKNNPIAIARHGDRVAEYEATGGETILNPEQSGKIEVLASKGDSPLHQYVRDLFRKFNSK